jgi:eukaryotic-like serine/threonine-protein kinase
LTQAFANGRYTVERVLGRGGMATVYLAHDSELERLVAVKVLDGGLAENAEAGDRFRREALTVARLSHPHVVAVFDAGEEDGARFIVMEYVEGHGLDSILGREAPLGVDRVVELGLQACDGLGYAHVQGVVHRDVKPANLLLRSDGVLKVSDFGIAHTADATQLTQVGTILGTTAYLAPEQARGEAVGPQADVFSLGVVLYQALTGSPPWHVETLAQVHAVGETPPSPVRSLVPGVPRNVESAIMRSLAREPRGRPADASLLGRELSPGTDPPTIRIDTATRVLPAQRHHRLPRLAYVVAGLLAAAMLALVIGIASRDDSDLPASKQPAQIAPVPSADDPAGQARNLEEWIREHSRRG